MSEHVFDELPRLLSGEASRKSVTTAAAHFRVCEDCRQELISAIVSHSALTSTARFARDLTAHAERGVSAMAAAEPIPDAASILARGQPESSPGDRPDASESPQLSRAWWLVAASVAALAVSGGGIAIATHHASPPAVSVALSAYDQGKTSGRARLIGEQEIKLDASTLPRLDSTHYYEVWLTDASRARMAPVGQLNSGGQGDFTVSTRSVRSLSAVEVSIQQTATTGNYSGVSVLRGSYA